MRYINLFMCYDDHFEMRDGRVVWKKDYKKRRKGEIAAHNNKIYFEGSSTTEAKVAYIIQTGKEPKGKVVLLDKKHKNYNLENLKDCDNSEAASHYYNKTGIRGVSYQHKGKLWCCRSYHKGQAFFLGSTTKMDELGKLEQFWYDSRAVITDSLLTYEEKKEEIMRMRKERGFYRPYMGREKYDGKR